MEYYMVFYKSLLICAIMVLIVVLHALSAFLKKPISSILAYVNIALHLVLVALLLRASATLGELAMIFMGSLVTFISLNLISEKLGSKEKGGEGNDI